MRNPLSSEGNSQYFYVSSRTGSGCCDFTTRIRMSHNCRIGILLAAVNAVHTKEMHEVIHH